MSRATFNADGTVIKGNGTSFARSNGVARTTIVDRQFLVESLQERDDWFDIMASVKTFTVANASRLSFDQFTVLLDVVLSSFQSAKTTTTSAHLRRIAQLEKELIEARKSRPMKDVTSSDEEEEEEPKVVEVKPVDKKSTKKK